MVFEVVFFTLFALRFLWLDQGERSTTHAYHCYQPRKPDRVPRWFHLDSWKLCIDRYVYLKFELFIL